MFYDSQINYTCLVFLRTLFVPGKGVVIKTLCFNNEYASMLPKN